MSEIHTLINRYMPVSLWNLPLENNGIAHLACTKALKCEAILCVFSYKKSINSIVLSSVLEKPCGLLASPYPACLQWAFSLNWENLYLRISITYGLP